MDSDQSIQKTSRWVLHQNAKNGIQYIMGGKDDQCAIV